MEGASSSTSSATSAGQSAGEGANAQSVAAPVASTEATPAPQLSEVSKPETTESVTLEKSPAEQKAEEKKVHAFLERMAKLTSKQYNSADEALDDAEEHWTKNEKVIDNYKKDDEMVWEVVKANPQMAKIIYDMYNGAPFEVATALHYDKDAFVPPEGSDNHKAWSENVAKRKESIAKHDELMKTIDSNLVETDNTFSRYVGEKKLDEAGTTALRNFINGLLDNAYHGKIGEEIFEMGHTYINKDRLMQEARESGEISARNEKIEIEKQKLNSVGDGTPHLNSSSPDVVEEKKPQQPANPFVTAIESFNNKRRRFPE